MTPEAFAAETHVSRETLERLKLYAATLERWNKAINLVSQKTLPDLWRRHFLDSAQLLPYLPELGEGRKRVLVDLGSGAGFPGLVLAILGAGEVHLIESDQRKAAFLREVSRETGAQAQIHVERIEAVTPFRADVVTARALAPLGDLLAYAEPFLAPDSLCLFLKGKSAEGELTAAAQEWKMKVKRHASRSDPSALLLEIQGPRRAP
jgi:16S rRNA (guanine527-N7)-methyltransferase